ncbi:hypothetical protein [Undibacterium umbellatum]|uniref:Uncharacterized protein n=1 Tax=Undibacterium umbellatum TaxID=2762300 RepID=A0ABR6ZG92_9BURK|nr:hypothetical protein [Undibacterium umbellatum]MBC3910752.1 hypothetical protein [Undibacterium umbellatum]
MSISRTRLFFGMASSLLAAPAFAAGPTAMTMLLKFGESIPGLWNFAQAMSFVVAMFLFGFSLFKLKRIGDRKSNEGMMSVVMTLLAATGLFYLSSSLDSFLVSTFGTSTIMTYTSSSILDAEGLKAAKVVIGFVNLIGLIAFARGWYALKMLGSGGGHKEDTAKRAIVLLVGGTFCLNIVALSEVLQRSLGISNIIN